MYKYAKNEDGTFTVTIIISGLFSKTKTYEYICSSEADVRALIVPNETHIADPGLMVSPTVVASKSAAACVAENAKIHKGETRVS